MKTKKLKNKLVLNKETVTNLEFNQLKRVKGGDVCDCTCCPTCDDLTCVTCQTHVCYVCPHEETEAKTCQPVSLEC